MLLQKLALLSEILPIIFYLCFLQRNKDTGLWVVFLYSLLSICVEVFNFNWKGVIDSFYVYAGLTICEYSIFSYLMFSSLKAKTHRLIILIGTAIFILIACYQLVDWKSRKFDTLSVSVEAILIIIYSILYLYQDLSSPATLYIYYTKKFWIVMAFFLYFSATLFLFVYAETFTEQQHATYWIINDFFDILKNILFCIAFTMKENRKSGIDIENPYSDIL